MLEDYWKSWILHLLNTQKVSSFDVDQISKFPDSFFHELTEENKKLHEKITQDQKEELIQALERRRGKLMKENVNPH